MHQRGLLRRAIYSRDIDTFIASSIECWISIIRRACRNSSKLISQFVVSLSLVGTTLGSRSSKRVATRWIGKIENCSIQHLRCLRGNGHSVSRLSVSVNKLFFIRQTNRKIHILDWHVVYGYLDNFPPLSLSCVEMSLSIIFIDADKTNISPWNGGIGRDDTSFNRAFRHYRSPVKTIGRNRADKFPRRRR